MTSQNDGSWDSWQTVYWLKSRSRWDLLINYHTKVTDNHPAFKPLGVKWLNRPLLLIIWTEIRAKHTVIHFYWAFLESGTKGGWIGQSGQRVKSGTVPQKTGRLAAMQRVNHRNIFLQGVTDQKSTVYDNKLASNKYRLQSHYSSNFMAMTQGPRWAGGPCVGNNEFFNLKL